MHSLILISNATKEIPNFIIVRPRIVDDPYSEVCDLHCKQHFSGLMNQKHWGFEYAIVT